MSQPEKSTKASDPFVGMQISPISFMDEGVDAVLDTLQHRVGVNVLMIGTISWLGLKVGRRISAELEGWPDHGVPAPYTMQGGSYIKSQAGVLFRHLHQALRFGRPRDGRAGHSGTRRAQGQGARHEGHTRIHGAAV